VLEKDCGIEFGDVAAMQLDKPLQFLLAAASISGQVAFGSTVDFRPKRSLSTF
jgi:hypothetical protein